MKDDREICGTCKYHKAVVRGAGDFECTCEDSVAYGVCTLYDAECELWETKDETD